MLEPTNRFLLVDALRPPAGTTLDRAVATTFTLDLNALLLATLSFAVHDRSPRDGGLSDPVALLESVRRFSDRVTVFAQAGALSVSTKHSPILAYLEDSVIPVRPPRAGHLFHPKVWVLRFVDEAGTPSHRLLVLSRNLTFDASWDVIARFDGTLTDSPQAPTEPIGRFVNGLAGQAVQPLSVERRSALGALADELAYVRFEHPEGVDALRFHPIGPGQPPPDVDGDRVLVISPFLSPATVARLGDRPGLNVVVSRTTGLDAAGADALRGYAETLVLDSGAAAVGDDCERIEATVDDDDAPPDVDIEPRPGGQLTGLHAKVIVAETGRRATLWLGSANATDAAFGGGNVEFLVEMRHRPGALSIDTVLDGGTPTNLRALLSTYRPEADEPVEPSELESAMYRIDSVLRDVATAAYTVEVTPVDDAYRLDLRWDDLDDDTLARCATHGIDLHLGPATLAAVRVPMTDSDAVIPTTSMQAITSFLVIEARTQVDGRDVAGRTLVNARLIGEPADRKDRVLADILDDPDKVLRYLLFLLAELTGDTSLAEMLGATSGEFDWTSTQHSPPLLETLLRALAHSPESFDRVAEFVADLRSGDGDRLLPPDFDAVWRPLAQAREAL